MEERLVFFATRLDCPMTPVGTYKFYVQSFMEALIELAASNRKGRLSNHLIH